ncbi:MAG TPA: YbaK/EbsC family protein [Blastocatellia bacterium]|nr:YbaK/EbsC family protein [Blastocatellia bacterium]
MSVATKLRQYLDNSGVDYSVLKHAPTYTAQDTAHAAHVPGKELAKSVVIKADDRFVLAVLPAPRKIDFERLKLVLNATELRIAREPEFSSLFPGCEAGAMPPLGNLYGLEVYVDESLSQDEEIVFNACTHVDAIRMKYEDFERLSTAQVAAFSSAGD